MKKLLFIALTLISSFAFAQNDITRTNPVGNNPANTSTYNKQSVRDGNLTAVLNLRIPVYSSFSLRNAKDSLGYIMYNTSISKMGVYKGSGIWDTISTNNTTSLINYYTKTQSDERFASIDSSVTSFNGRTGAISPIVGDYSTFYPVLSGSYSDPSWLASLPFSKVTGTPTTLTGYGITDATPSARTVTINGSTQDLSANRTYNVGTVTSVAKGIGLVADGAITSTGTINIDTAVIRTVDNSLSKAQTQSALNLKANLANPTFTGTVSGITASMVGLGNVDNTTDLLKPISTATQNGLDLKENLSNKSTDFSTVNNTLYPTVQAVKTYADGLVVGLLNDRGSYDPTITSAYPITGGSGTAGAIKKGDIWYVSANGTIGGTTVLNGYSVRALADSPAQTAGSWNILQVGLGYVPENVANKATDLTSPDNTKYPTTLAVSTALSGKQATYAGLQDSITKKANRTLDNVASGAIANVKLANSTISGVSLGSNLNALTLGTGLTGSSYNGSGAVTTNIDTTVIRTVANSVSLSELQTKLNTKQNTLTNPVTGTGTSNYLTKFTGSNTVVNSLIRDDGTTTSIGGISPIAQRALALYASGTSYLHILNDATGITSSDGASIGYFSGEQILNVINREPGGHIDFAAGNAATQVRLTSAGLLGVNTTSPSVPLDVNGAGKFSGNLTVPSIKITTGANTGYVLTSDSDGDGTWVSPASGLTYKGAWNASSNSPTLADGSGTNGDMYAISTGGTQFSRSFIAGGFAIYNGTIWEPVGTSSAVTSVNGYTGSVTLAKSDIGLSNADNTTDLNKPISTATQTALDLKANSSLLSDYLPITAESSKPLSGTLYTKPGNGIRSASSGTGNNYGFFPNTGGGAIWGTESSTGGSLFINSSSYSSVFGNTGNYPTQFATNNIIRYSISSAGDNTWTGAGSFAGNLTALNLSGTNTGDQTWTTLSGKPTFATVATTGAYADLSGKPTIPTNNNTLTNGAGYITSSSLTGLAPLASPTFTGTVSGITAAMVGAPSGSGTSSGTNTGDQTNISGNAATVTTNANLTGVVTSVGNTTSIANGAISNALLANSAVANLSGTNTGDQNLTPYALTSSLGTAAFTASTAYKASSYVPSWSEITSKPTFASVATSGAYSDLSGTPNMALYAPLASPTFTGTVSGINSTMVGLGSVENKSSATIRGEITSGNVTTALGFTPYNATNPSGFTSNVGTVTSVGATAGTGISVSGSPITSSGSLTITNTAPDQTVTLTGGTNISTSGTYPNFTITNGITNNNQLTNGAGYTTNTGTVTSIASGNGMNFTTIAGSGTVTMGTPSAITSSSTNSTSTTSHSHELTSIPSATSATTQSQGDNSAKVATTAYVDGLGATILAAQKQIANIYTNVSTSSTFTEDLFISNIAQSHLSSVGDKVEFSFYGIFGLNASDKYVTISIGGNVMPVSSNASNKSIWEVEGYLLRTSSTTFRIFYKTSVDNDVAVSQMYDKTVSDFNPLQFIVKGQTNNAAYPVTVSLGYLQSRKTP